jgi:hypothetical protein
VLNVELIIQTSRRYLLQCMEIYKYEQREGGL